MTIRERSEGSFEIRIYVGRVDGKPKRITKTHIGTRREAARIEAQIKADVLAGRIGAPVRNTVGDLLEQWYEACEADWSPGTRNLHRTIIDLYLRPLLGDIALAKLDTARIDIAYGKLRKLGLGAARVKRIHGVLHSALETARRRWKMIVINPATDANPGKQHRRPISTVSHGEFEAVLSMARPVHERYYRVNITTGARPQEVCALQVGDIDTETGTIRIRRRVVRGKNKSENVVVDLTKSGKERTLRVGPDIMKLLVEQMGFMEMRLKEHGNRLTVKSYVFSEDHVSAAVPWDPHLPSQHWRRLCKKVGVEGLRLYDLRHTSATQLANKGVPINVISDRLGHARKSTTLDFYTGALPGADVEAAAIMDVLFGGASDSADVIEDLH